ncbi:putative D-amino acid oxidase [Geobacillus thermodenitrificans]|uniref:NAD(P)/FAD-dependent oxidoreductase n=1 Tax=Geobacillus TaxID=129337 RepID=UPI0006E5B148|nr:MULTISPECIES: FAD-binding oxidoreductase [Geobacillus]ARP42381.1 putative D-amino acid oxidase [Geobacillus thermodenitrificans]KQB93700.1 putative oxidoreductase YurR [Geobacillus sp. PA-3]MEC5186275.1 D-amino-acid dehydrogenase [Geobacillus thermodenitrificans]MED3717968.1 FAD-binding oxidoreductase [Geobacillus thermodenitrificans]
MGSYIVVGAGILGAAVAYHLAKEGAAVTIIDRGDKGQATDAAAGIVCPWLSQRRNQKWYRLAKGGAKFYPSLIEELQSYGETETGYARVGTLCLHTDEQKLEQMKARALKRREDAPEIGDIVQLDPKEAKELFPLLADGYQAIYVSGGARVNGRALRTALLNAAQKLGAIHVRGNARLLHQGTRIIGVEADGTTYAAEAVIITAGAWAGELLRPLGIELLVTPQKGQLIHLEHPNHDTSHWPVVMPPSNQYMLAFPRGRMVIGTTHEDEAGLDVRPTAGGMHELLDKALTVAPGLSVCTYIETRVGFRPRTPGFLPIFGVLPGFTGLYVANGLGSSGLTVGPYLGAELAKLVLGIPTELDPHDYDVTSAIAPLA